MDKFYHHLRDTIILLGGGTRLANMASKPDEITQSDVDELRNLNIRLITSTKQRLLDLNTIKVDQTDAS